MAPFEGVGPREARGGLLEGIHRLVEQHLVNVGEGAVNHNLRAG